MSQPVTAPAWDLAAARAALAPRGVLRPGMNLGNTLFTQREAASGALRGVSVDLMQELGACLGVPVEQVVYPTPGDVADTATADAWDVAILAIEPARAETIVFSPAMTEIDASYVVHADSPLTSCTQADAPGVRIVAPAKAGYELYLTRTLRKATLVRTRNFKESMALFSAREADALAGLRPGLLEVMPTLTQARLLEDQFMVVNHGLGAPRSRAGAAEALAAFVAAVNASGFIAASIAAHGVQGLRAVKRAA